jgi:hypothetical protein
MDGNVLYFRAAFEGRTKMFVNLPSVRYFSFGYVRALVGDFSFPLP